MTKFALTFSLIIGLYFNSSAQTTNLREIFLAAESYFLFEEFEEALPLYLRVHRDNPDNDNVNYKIGVCYLNIPYEKSKSVSHLEQAAQNINPKYRENNYRETSAPPEALFYLANAYRINNQFDNAREYYNKFLEVLDSSLFDIEMVTEQLNILDAAEKLLTKPVDLDYQILNDKINTRFSDEKAVISGNEKGMVFISRLQFYDAVLYSEKINGEWSTPRNIIPELGVDGDVYPTCLSWDGTELYIYRSDDFIGNLYVSKLSNGKWQPIVKLNDNINTKFWESHGSVNKEGNKLYFTSNRKEGYGGLDIYVSERTGNGDWGIATNLGPVVNTKYNEETPFITEDGKKLFFSSYGHYNMGGYDVFVSILKEDKTWAEPRNLGYPVNTLDDDIFYHPYRNGQLALYSRYREDGFGRHDIYDYQVYTHEFPRTYNVSGHLDFSGVSVDSSDVQISVYNTKTNEILTTFNPNSDGSFSFKAPSGSYDIVFKSSKFYDYMKDIEVSPTTPHSGMVIPGLISLIPVPPVQTPEDTDKLLTLRDTLLNVKAGKTAKLRFNADRGATVIIDVFNDSMLIASDTIDSARRRDVFEFKPNAGSNLIEFKAIDKDGNSITKRAEVIAETPAHKKPEPEIITKKPDQLQSSSLKDETTGIYKNILINQAEDNLKNFLEKINLDNENISTKEDLISYLRKEAPENQYTTDDVKLLIEKASGNLDLDKFLQNLTRVSRGNLKNTLAGFIPTEKGVTTPYELIDHLLDNSQAYGYKNQDLIHSLGILASGERNDINGFLNELIQQSDGKLKEYLSTLSPSLPGIKSPAELAVYIHNQADQQGFNEKDFAKILTTMALKEALNSFREDLTQMADGAIKKELMNLDYKESGIQSSQDLMEFLYDKAGTLNFETKDVDNLLSEMAISNYNQIEKLRIQLIQVASGPLLKFLKEINIQDYAFNSEEEFLNFLYANTESKGYTKDDLNYALLKLAYDWDLEDIIRKLANIAEGNLKQTLLNLDPERENIHDFNSLQQYLINNGRNFGYSEDDVYELLKKYFSLTDAELFLRKLIRISEGEMKNYLRNIDIIELKIANRQELINHLLTEADKGIIDKEEIIRLILKADEIIASQIIKDLKAISKENILKYIDAAGNEKSLVTADQVFDYLLNASLSNSDLTHQDVLDLFTDYLKNFEIKRLIQSLANSAQGGVKEALLKLEIGKEGVKNTGDLIDYLLSETSRFGYTPVDIFNLFQTVLGAESLKDFVQQLLPFTYGNLRDFSQSFDLNETGITSIEALMEYFLNMSGTNNYEKSDVWDAIVNLILSKDEFRETIPQDDKIRTSNDFFRNFALTGGILALLGLIIFFLILYKRKKKKKKNE